jgi:hypothetical protein
VIVAVCADKGSPGVTTLALALGLVWPGQRMLLEADPAGADLAFRLHHADSRGEGGGGRGVGLASEPSVLSLAVDARTGLATGSLPGYVQQTRLGVAVIPGPPTAEDHHPMRDLWPQVAREAAAWGGVVIADLGRLQPWHPALPLVQAATVVLVLARPDVEGLYRVRHRVTELGHLLSGGDDAPGVAVAVLASRGQSRAAVDHATRVLAASGSSAVVVGVVAVDPSGVGALHGRERGRRLGRSPLVTSAAALADAMISRWPLLAGTEPSPHEVVA